MAYKRKGDKIINKYGVKIRTDEIKELRRLVNKANRRRVKALDEINSQERRVLGKGTGETIGQFKSRAMGDLITGFEETFIHKKKSANLNQFKTQKAYDTFIRNLKPLDNNETATLEGIRYKDNYIKSLKHGLNLHGNTKLVQRIKKMKTDDFLKLASSDERFNITYTYSEHERIQKIATLTAILNNYTEE